MVGMFMSWLGMLVIARVAPEGPGMCLRLVAIAVAVAGLLLVWYVVSLSYFMVGCEGSDEWKPGLYTHIHGMVWDGLKWGGAVGAATAAALISKKPSVLIAGGTVGGLLGSTGAGMTAYWAANIDNIVAGNAAGLNPGNLAVGGQAVLSAIGQGPYVSPAVTGAQGGSVAPVLGAGSSSGQIQSVISGSTGAAGGGGKLSIGGPFEYVWDLLIEWAFLVPQLSDPFTFLTALLPLITNPTVLSLLASRSPSLDPSTMGLAQLYQSKVNLMTMGATLSLVLLAFSLVAIVMAWLALSGRTQAQAWLAARHRQLTWIYPHPFILWFFFVVFVLVAFFAAVGLTGSVWYLFTHPIDVEQAILLDRVAADLATLGKAEVTLLTKP